MIVKTGLKKEKRREEYYLVTCEHPKHLGPRERLITKNKAELGIDIQICALCQRKEAGYTNTKDKSDYIELAQIANLEFVGSVPKSTSVKTLWRCLSGHEWETSYSSIKSGRRCPVCLGWAHKTIEDYVKLAEMKGVELILPIPQNTECVATWRCSCGNIINRSYENLRCNKGQCYECYIISRSGENHPLWNAEITEEERSENRFDSPGYQTFRTEVRMLYSYRCFLCSSQQLPEIHHILNWGEFPKLRYDFQNVIILCKEHHKEFHSKYGRTKNNKYQLESYLGYKLNYNCITNKYDI